VLDGYVEGYAVPYFVLIVRFFAVAANAPLVLEGPPGIGKTMVVAEVCRILNIPLERINFSGSTTLEQLFGSVVPQVVNGVRAFQWQDGKLTAALAAKKFVILDEVNLCPLDVLDALSSLLVRNGTGASFIVPGSGGVTLHLEDVRFFATMNPASAGGNRTRLPRSIAACFTPVYLEAYDVVDMFMILKRLFKDLLTDESTEGLITLKDLEHIFALHQDVQRHVGARKLGRIGGPFDFNLRDLTKLYDVLRGNAKDLLDHMKFFRNDSWESASVSAGGGAGSGSILEADCVKGAALTTGVSLASSAPFIVAVRAFARLVYGACFQCDEDQAVVRGLVDKHLPIPATFASPDVDDVTVDASVPGFVRIGAVYMRTGDRAPGHGAVEALVHTRATVTQLSMLAAAAQSKRPVLLEGECAGKTALVRELARLCQRHLVVVSMNENMETSDLIGQWLPASTSSPFSDGNGVALVDMHIQWWNAFDSAVRHLLLKVVPLLVHQDDLAKLTLLLQVTGGFSPPCRVDAVVPSSAPDTSINFPAFLEVVAVAITALDVGISAPFSASHVVSVARVKATCVSMKRRLEAIAWHLRQLIAASLIDAAPAPDTPDGGHGNVPRPPKSFLFVESVLVKALVSGDWVLLDNANSCPPEVLERLNSLLEQDRVLNLYECGNGKEYSDAEGTIHDDFRVFATANTKRAHSNKLSAAFLNRMVRLWLPEVDTNPDLVDIVTMQCAGMHGGRELARVAVEFHKEMLELERRKEIGPVCGYSFTFRSLVYAIRTALFVIRENRLSPVFALVWGLLRTYTACLGSPSQRARVIAALRMLLERELSRWHRYGIQFSFTRQLSSARRRVDADFDLMSPEMVDLERLALQCIGSMLVGGSGTWGTSSSLSPTRSESALHDAVVSLLRKVLIPLNPKDPRPMELLTALEDHTTSARECVSSFSFKYLTGCLCGPGDTSLEHCVRLVDGKREGLCRALRSFLANASFSDAAERHDVLVRVTACLFAFADVLSLCAIVNEEVSSHAVAVLHAIRLVIRDGCDQKVSLQPLFQSAVVQQWRGLDDMLNVASERSAAWALKREMAAPAIGCHARIEAVIRFLVQRVENPVPLHSFGFLLRWLAVGWRVEIRLLLSNAFGGVLDDDLLKRTQADSMTRSDLEAAEIKLRALECVVPFWTPLHDLGTLLDNPVSDAEIRRLGDERLAKVQALSALEKHQADIEGRLTVLQQQVDNDRALMYDVAKDSLRIDKIRGDLARVCGEIKSACSVISQLDGKRAAARQQLEIQSSHRLKLLSDHLDRLEAIATNRHWVVMTSILSWRLLRSHQTIVACLSRLRTQPSMVDAEGCLIPAQVFSECGLQFREVDLRSECSRHLTYLWNSLFLSSAAFRSLPPNAEVILLDCSLSRAWESVVVPRSKADPFVMLVFCYNSTLRGGCPLSLLVVTSRVESRVGRGSPHRSKEVLYLTHYASAYCAAQSDGVASFATKLESVDWVARVDEQLILHWDCLERPCEDFEQVWPEALICLFLADMLHLCRCIYVFFLFLFLFS
jgi:MoxR-like ATPase